MFGGVQPEPGCSVCRACGGAGDREAVGRTSTGADAADFWNGSTTLLS